MKILKIGAITLDYGMWWDEYNRSDAVSSEIVKNLDGGIIIFEQANRVSIQNVTLKSNTDAWQRKATVDALVALSNGSLGQVFVIEDDNGVFFNARFRHEQAGGAVQFVRASEAKLFEWYTGTIYLAKV